jgi:hypothetical protein
MLAPLILPGAAFGSAVGTISMDVTTDENGIILSRQGRAILFSDDTFWWSTYQHVGDYAQIDVYVDGRLARAKISRFIMTRAPRYIDNVRDNTVKRFSWWPSNLDPGDHVIGYQLLDVYRGEWYTSGGHRREVGNVIAEYPVYVHVDEAGNQYLDHNKAMNQGFRYEQCQLMEGDPINVGTGNSFQQETDISIPGVGAPLTFTRYYNSQSSFLGSSGFGWTHTFEVQLTQTDDLHAEIRREDGGTSRFFKNPDDIYMENASRPT